jgi:hypothetical protein
MIKANTLISFEFGSIDFKVHVNACRRRHRCTYVYMRRLRNGSLLMCNNLPLISVHQAQESTFFEAILC